MITKKLADYKDSTPSIVTIGTFDGVHVGHKKIIKQLVNKAYKNNLRSIVLTFFPHPKIVLQPDLNIKLINTISEKELIFDSLGLDYLIIQKFNKEFSRLTALEFVRDILVNKLHVKHVIIGYDHHFGRNRLANINDLRDFGNFYGFEVIEIPAHDIDNITVSSTKIRKSILKGNIIKTNKYLGYNFSIKGEVIYGKGIGRTLNFPTANLKLQNDYKLVPSKGVYVISSQFESEIIYGMMNIGYNPTFNNKEESIEIHFFNFNMNIYGKNISVELLIRLRDEKKFESSDELMTQLEIDKKKSINFINEFI